MIDKTHCTIQSTREVGVGETEVQEVTASLNGNSHSLCTIKGLPLSNTYCHEYTQTNRYRCERSHR